MSADGCTSELVALLRESVDLQRQVLSELRQHRLQAEGKRYRDELIHALGTALALGPTWQCAQQLALILAGAAEAPARVQAQAALLRTLPGGELSARHLLRILQRQAQEAAADKISALCQWPPRTDHGASSD
jgi:hypothetical protein